MEGFVEGFETQMCCFRLPIWMESCWNPWKSRFENTTDYATRFYRNVCLCGLCSGYRSSPNRVPVEPPIMVAGRNDPVPPDGGERRVEEEGEGDSQQPVVVHFSDPRRDLQLENPHGDRRYAESDSVVLEMSEDHRDSSHQHFSMSSDNMGSPHLHQDASENLSSAGRITHFSENEVNEEVDETARENEENSDAGDGYLDEETLLCKVRVSISRFPFCSFFFPFFSSHAHEISLAYACFHGIFLALFDLLSYFPS